MTNNLKLLILVNWKEEGRWDFYKSLKNLVKQPTVLRPFFTKWLQGNWGQQLAIYLSDFYLPVLAFARRRQFDVVITWTQRMGIWYGILNRLFPNKAAPKHIFYDFHINLTRNDLLFHLKLALVKMALPGIDYFLTTSTEEASIYCTMFHTKPSRIRFFPMTPARHYLKSYEFPRENYILSFGNSDRDYATLVKAVTTIQMKVIILSQAYRPREPLPDTVILITEKRVGMDLIKLIVASRLVVLPLQDFNISAGQTAMLEVMALGRPLVVTRNMATSEYATHGESALFFEAGNAGALRANIQFLVQHPDIAEDMGIRARQRSMHYPDQQVSVFADVLQYLFS